MLIIRRRAGESILLGEEIELSVIEVTAGAVRLGIRAPEQVLILRKEIRLAEEANRAASQTVAASSVASLVARLRRHSLANSKTSPSGR